MVVSCEKLELVFLHLLPSHVTMVEVFVHCTVAATYHDPVVSISGDTLPCGVEKFSMICSPMQLGQRLKACDILCSLCLPSDMSLLRLPKHTGIFHEEHLIICNVTYSQTRSFFNCNFPVFAPFSASELRIYISVYLLRNSSSMLSLSISKRREKGRQVEKYSEETPRTSLLSFHHNFNSPSSPFSFHLTFTVCLQYPFYNFLFYMFVLFQNSVFFSYSFSCSVSLSCFLLWPFVHKLIFKTSLHC